MDAAVRVVVQARMGSTRLPGKILARLSGRTVLEHVVSRLQAAERQWHSPWEVVVATTTRPEDDRTALACRELGVRCIRGDVNDVLSRYLLAVDDLCDDAVALRATADNPLYCPERTAAIAREHFAGESDYTSIRELSYVVPEVFRVGALRDMARVAVDPYHREHVTPFFRQFPWAYRVQSLTPTWRGLQPHVPLTVDTEADFARMERLFQDCARPGAMVALEDAYRWSAVHDGVTVQRAAA